MPTKFRSEYNLGDYEAQVLCAEKSTANFYEEVCKVTDPILSAKWIIGEVNALLNKNDVSLNQSNINSKNFSNLILKITDGTISGKIAKEVFLSFSLLQLNMFLYKINILIT